MNRIEPLSRDNLPEQTAAIVELTDQFMGFVPNDVMVMAKWPELLQAINGLFRVVYGPGRVDDNLKQMVGLISSAASGCRYCQAHTAHAATSAGISAEKVSAIWEYETSPLFSPEERAAFKVADGGGRHPNGVSDEDFRALLEHFDERQALEIVAVIAFFGFLNRWNETLATSLESAPAAVAEATLSAGGWNRGRHG